MCFSEEHYTWMVQHLQMNLQIIHVLIYIATWMVQNVFNTHFLNKKLRLKTQKNKETTRGQLKTKMVGDVVSQKWSRGTQRGMALR